MTLTTLVVGFVVLAAVLALAFFVLWRQDAGRADEQAEDTARLDVEPEEPWTAEGRPPTDPRA